MTDKPVRESLAVILERHAVTLICALILAAVVWAGSSITGQRDDIIRLTAITEQQIDTLSDIVKDHEQRLRDLEHMRQTFRDPLPSGPLDGG